MAFIAVPFGMRVALEFTLAGRPVVNVYHVVASTPIVTIDLENVAAVFVTWWTDSMAQIFASTLELHRVTVTDVSVAAGQQHETLVDPPVTGAQTTPALPNNVALVASTRTGLTGRSNRGRTYLAGLAEATVTANSITSTDAVAIAALYMDVQELLDGGDYTLVVASFQSGGLPRVVAQVRAVTEVLVGTRVDTQRRRLRGVQDN